MTKIWINENWDNDSVELVEDLILDLVDTYRLNCHLQEGGIFLNINVMGS
jgi:hypothetical protein